ncbi:hypothetical protein HDV03_000725 [Kappamyces sp. JEL0829]|nr:hypothetical protein HDV03_000725 [Kappamyces sp. JEL0829]
MQDGDYSSNASNSNDEYQRRKPREFNSRPCDNCRLKKRKCDGVKPICGTCSRARKGKGVCSYKGEVVVKSHSSIQSIESMQTNSSVEGSHGRAENHCVPLPPNENPFDSLFTLPRQQHEIQLLLPSLQPQSPEFLFDLGIPKNYIEITSGDCSVESAARSPDFAYLAAMAAHDGSQQLPQYHPDALTEPMHKALAFLACFSANHHKLFPNASASFPERLAMANDRFLDANIHDQLLTLQGNREICDGIRALLIRIEGEALLCRYEQLESLLRQSYRMCSAKGVLHPQTFMGSYHRSVTVDDLSGLYEKPAVPIIPLAEHERMERFSLLASLLATDLYTSIVTGSPFVVDDVEFPDTFLYTDHHPYYYSTPSSDPFHPLVSAKIQIKIFKFFRKIVRFSRSFQFYPDVVNAPEQLRLHLTTLKLMRDLYEQLFTDNLTWFIFESKTLPPAVADRPIDERTHTHTVKFLCKLVYLHFPTLHYTQTKFPLVSGGPFEFTSRDIIFAAVRVLWIHWKRLEPQSFLAGLGLSGMVHVILSCAATGFLSFHSHVAQIRVLFGYLKDISQCFARSSHHWLLHQEYHKTISKRLSMYPKDWHDGAVC